MVRYSRRCHTSHAPQCRSSRADVTRPSASAADGASAINRTIGSVPDGRTWSQRSPPREPQSIALVCFGVRKTLPQSIVHRPELWTAGTLRFDDGVPGRRCNKLRYRYPSRGKEMQDQGHSQGSIAILSGCATFTHSGYTPAIVDAITPTGVVWSWTASDNFSCSTALAPTPDGGVVLFRASTPRRATSISSTGATRWDYSPSAPVESASLVDATTPIVDTSGNVAIPFNYLYSTPTSPQNEGVGVDFVSASTGAVTLPPVIVQSQNCSSDFGNNFVAADIGPDQLYLGLAERCSPPLAPLSVQAFGVPGLGANYRTSIATPGFAYLATVPSGLVAGFVRPAPDGTQVAVFQGPGPLLVGTSTYIVRLGPNTQPPYTGLVVPGFTVGDLTFGPDSTIYFAAQAPTASYPSTLLRWRSGANTAEQLSGSQSRGLGVACCPARSSTKVDRSTSTPLFRAAGKVAIYTSSISTATYSTRSGARSDYQAPVAGRPRRRG